MRDEAPHWMEHTMPLGGVMRCQWSISRLLVIYFVICLWRCWTKILWDRTYEDLFLNLLKPQLKIQIWAWLTTVLSVGCKSSAVCFFQVGNIRHHQFWRGVRSQRQIRHLREASQLPQMAAPRHSALHQSAKSTKATLQGLSETAAAQGQTADQSGVMMLLRG